MKTQIPKELLSEEEEGRVKDQIAGLEIEMDEFKVQARKTTGVKGWYLALPIESRNMYDGMKLKLAELNFKLQQHNMVKYTMGTLQEAIQKGGEAPERKDVIEEVDEKIQKKMDEKVKDIKKIMESRWTKERPIDILQNAFLSLKDADSRGVVYGMLQDKENEILGKRELFQKVFDLVKDGDARRILRAEFSIWT